MSNQELLISAASLESAIDRHPQFVTPDSPVTEILETIRQLNPSCPRSESDSQELDRVSSSYVLVVPESVMRFNQTQLPEPSKTMPKKSQILGIITAEDILRVMAAEKSLHNLPIADLMNPEAIALNQSDRPNIFTVLSLWRQYGMTPLLLFDQTEQLLGVITPENIISTTLQSPENLESRTETLATPNTKLQEELQEELREELREELQEEILKRRQAEAELQRVQQDIQQQVEQRTADLKKANERLKQDIMRQQEVETALRRSEAQSRQQAKQLEIAIEKLKKTQAELVQMEKMSGLGQLVAGIAHEINNPVNFIYGNITHATAYIQDIINLVDLYQTNYPNPVEEIQETIEDIELDFLMIDLPKLLQSMQSGSERIRHIVQSLRNFSRLDEAAVKEVDIHQGIESTLLILQHRLKGKLGKPSIEVCKDYGNLPKVECYPSLLNQVFMNLLNNALDALENEPHPQVITINTRSFTVDSCQLEANHHQDWTTSYVRIAIADNGQGMDSVVQKRIFEPFFTTKNVGKGTGLGLSTSYQIVVEKHSGKLEVISAPGEGAELVIEIPIKQPSDREPPLFNSSTV